MKPKVLITDDVHPILADGLRADGFEVDYLPTVTEDTVWQIIPQYEGLVINSRIPATRKLLQRAARLKFVCRAGSGLEVIDLEAAKELNIAAFNSPDGNAIAVGEHALGMLLALLNNLVQANSDVKSYNWNREANRGYELSGKTVGLIAYGTNARAFAKLLRGFDVKILAYDKYLSGFGNEWVTEASLEQIFAEADVLSLHLPLTHETEYMINNSFFARFKKPIWFLNISRGKVLDTNALLQAITEGKVMAAALDVLENEKLSTLNPAQKETFEQLVNNKKILLSPHIAGWTYESKQKIATILLHRIQHVYKG